MGKFASLVAGFQSTLRELTQSMTIVFVDSLPSMTNKLVEGVVRCHPLDLVVGALDHVGVNAESPEFCHFDL